MLQHLLCSLRFNSLALPLISHRRHVGEYCIALMLLLLLLLLLTFTPDVKATLS